MHPSPPTTTSTAITSPRNLLQMPTPPAFIRPETFRHSTLTGTLPAVRESVDPDIDSPEPEIGTLTVADRFAPQARRDPISLIRRPVPSTWGQSALNLPDSTPSLYLNKHLAPEQVDRLPLFKGRVASTVHLTQIRECLSHCSLFHLSLRSECRSFPSRAHPLQMEPHQFETT
jgi:hypothetical protein